MNLNQLPKYKLAIVTGFDGSDSDLETRLREIGFAEGDEVEKHHVGLFGGNPMSIRLNGTHIAMRRAEAAAVQVRLSDD